ncbi:hypothetical protein NYE48_01605 [Paenibacillus sp. FSL M7-1455]|uniref:Uncharacterized protein n=1 Tax=Paenibacillus cookii TaxID=157839 RepID=A0ABQ4LVH1_9BACL|nr:hypothetical protein [Paenibacillus cookii]GIO67254.1 hypothetical protein J21TS3_20750 [Paenibacillus cookii]
MKKGIASFLLAAVLMITLSFPVQAQSIDDGEVIAKGVALPIPTFNQLYGTPSSSDNAITNLDKNVTANIHDIQLQDANLSFKAEINYNNQVKELDATGKLFKGYKQEDSINSIVGDIEDKGNHFGILLFEIYNDKAPDKVITNDNLAETPHLKLYLTDQEDNVILLEMELPEQLAHVTVTNDEAIDTTKDFFWFINVIKPYEKRNIPTDDKMKKMLGVNPTEVSPTAVGYFSDWTHSTTYYQSFYIGSDFVQTYSLPYGSWKALDVTNQSTWTNSFKIAEHTTVNGVTNRSIDNPFRYRNVKLSTGVGAKSTIVFAMTDGRLSSYATGSSLTLKIAEKLWSTALPAAPSISDIKGWINAIVDAGTDKTVTLGSSNIKLNSNPTVVEGANSKNYDMYRYTDINGANTGHNMVLQTTVQYDSTTGTSATANGVMKVKWDVYYGATGSLYDSSSKDISFTYSVKP